MVLDFKHKFKTPVVMGSERIAVTQVVFLLLYKDCTVMVYFEFTI